MVLPISHKPSAWSEDDPEDPAVTVAGAILITDPFTGESCIDLSFTFDDADQQYWGVHFVALHTGRCKSSHGRITGIQGKYRFKRIISYSPGGIYHFWGLWQQYLFGADAVGHPTGGFYFWRADYNTSQPGGTFTTRTYPEITDVDAHSWANMNGPLNAEVDATGLTGPQFDTDLPVYLGFGFNGGIPGSLYSPTYRYDYVEVDIYYDDSPTVSETITLGDDLAWSVESCTEKFLFY